MAIAESEDNTKRHRVSLTLATVTTGLISGLLFAFQVAIIPAFTRLSDAEYVNAMQAINKDIQNPIFILCFLGAPAFLLTSVYAHRNLRASQKFRFMLMAAGVYLLGVFGVTFGGNIPLNEKLASFDLQKASAQEVTTARKDFETPWNGLHLVRTLASIAALTLLVVAIQQEDTDK